MGARFDTVHNINEETVFSAVGAAAARYPKISNQPGVLADIACVALNRIPPRYVRHDIDLSSSMNDEDRTQNEAAVKAAVEFAFDFVQRRSASPGRE